MLAGNNFFGVTAFPGGADNSGYLDSIEHRFNFLPNLQPLGFARADVVWIVASGKTAQEVSFDAYVNPDSFILSSGMGTVTNESAEGPATYHDGFDCPTSNTYTATATGDGMVHPPRVQNSATAVSPEVVAASGGRLPKAAGRWRVPSYGIPGGDLRIEPVNAGGVAGIEKGLWLSGEGSVRYAIPAQPDEAALAAAPWYAGIFLDSRPAPGDGASTVRRVLTFPDGSVLELVGLGTLRFGMPGALRSIALPLPAPAVDWVHLAVLSTPTTLSLYEDGFLFATFDTKAAPLFRMAEGTLTVGATGASAGFRGWMDRFEVFADAPNAELACNRALGTIVGLTATSGPLYDQAKRYPSSSQDAVSAALPGGDRHPLYACFFAYGSEFGATLPNLPSGATPLRTAILFPEGPLVWNEPRPDSSKNLFCRECHASDLPHTLQVSALVANPSLTEFADPRRRPTQPPPSLFGNVPASYLGPGVPAAATGAGLDVDSFLYPPP